MALASGSAAQEAIEAQASPVDNPHGREPASAATPATPSSVVREIIAEAAVYTDSNAVTVITPSSQFSVGSRGGDWSARGQYLVDIVTAASVDIVSTASEPWTEVRHAGGLSGTYKPKDVGGTLSISASREPDYVSLNAGALVTFELLQKSLNPFLGYSFTHDTAGRTGTPYSVFSQQLVRHDFTVGSEFVVGRSTTLSLEIAAVLERGDPSKPYRYLPVFSPAVAGQIERGASIAEVNQARLPARISERVPHARNRFAASGRLLHRFDDFTVMLFERVYRDDWGLWASTTDARSIHDLTSRLMLWFGGRFHVQDSVFFWERAYTAELSGNAIHVPTYRTGDRELSALFAATANVGLRLGVGPGTQPNSSSITLQLDETATEFRDALYLDSRWAHLVMLGAEAEF
jgi:hypothetical protein